MKRIKLYLFLIAQMFVCTIIMAQGTTPASSQLAYHGLSIGGGLGYIHYKPFLFDVRQAGWDKHIAQNGDYKPFLTAIIGKYHFIPKNIGITFQYRLAAHSYHLPGIQSKQYLENISTVNRLLLQNYLVGFSFMRKLTFKQKWYTFLLDVVGGATKINVPYASTQLYVDKYASIANSAFFDFKSSTMGKCAGINLSLIKPLKSSNLFVECSYLYSEVKYRYNNDFTEAAYQNTAAKPIFKPIHGKSFINTLSLSIGIQLDF